MKKVKAILCDVDGTLSDYDSYILPGVKPLIKKIQEKGIRFSLATGRAYYSNVKKIESELNIKGIHILQGGAIIFNSLTNKVILSQAISSKSVETIVKYLSTQKLIFSLEAKNNVYISEILNTKTFYPEIPNKTLVEFKNKEPILKIVIYARVNQLTEEKINLHKKNLQNLSFDITIHNFNHRLKNFNFFGADITSEKATKHTAVLEYLKILNLLSDEVVAIGDGLNDYPLFTACGFGIAMANAPKELKDIAALVVPSVEDGGMVEALEYIYNNLI